jgi:protein-S-isoprenylcysteine O-methyltransferase Ste14
MIRGKGGALQVQHSFLEFLSRIISKNRITLSFVGAAVFLYFAAPARSTIIAGIPLILIGEIIRTWSSGFIKKNEVLSQSGPYSMTRNPLYLGNFLIGLGFSIMTNNIILLCLFLAVFFFIYTMTIQSEEKLLLAKFGDTYIKYKERVPVFFPLKAASFKKSSWDNSSVHFDWRLVIKHREHHTWLGIIAGLIIFLVKLAFFTAA